MAVIGVGILQDAERLLERNTRWVLDIRYFDTIG
jgi:hypothetical protein